MKTMTAVLLLMLALPTFAVTLKDLGMDVKNEQVIEDIAQDAKREPASVPQTYNITIRGACQSPNGLSVYSGTPGYEECINYQAQGGYPLYDQPTKSVSLEITTPTEGEF